MNGEFTNACTWYYQLTQRLAKQQSRLETLLYNALPYTGQTNLEELDRIIRCNRKIQAVRADADKTDASLREAQKLILQIMQYFEMPPNTRLTGEIPEEIVFELWADENGRVHYEKIADLAKEEENPNVLIIKFNTGMSRVEEDEE